MPTAYKQATMVDFTHEAVSGKVGGWEWFVEWSEELSGWTARFVMPLNWHYYLYERYSWIESYITNEPLKVWQFQDQAVAAVLAAIEKVKSERRRSGYPVPE